MFKVGDKVRCVNKSDYVGDHELTFGKEYTVKTVQNTTAGEPPGYIQIENNSGDVSYYKPTRFELVEEEAYLLTMSFEGTTVSLDTSNTLSRKLAEAFLNVVFTFQGNK